MKRAPLVLTGTVAGLAGILAYHTAAPSTASVAAASSGSSTAVAATTPAGTTSTTATTAATTTAVKTSTAAATRAATGEDVSYQYGDLEVKVTETGGKITGISVAKLDVSDPHSQQIDQYAIPQLSQQAMSAQSAKINGVSGASYTSAAYEQSLQSALDKLA